MCLRLNGNCHTHTTERSVNHNSGLKVNRERSANSGISPGTANTLEQLDMNNNHKTNSAEKALTVWRIIDLKLLVLNISSPGLILIRLRAP